MLTISSRTDIETYVATAHHDFVTDHLDGALVAAIQGADHPDYGCDWEEWLDKHIDQIREAVVTTSA